MLPPSAALCLASVSLCLAGSAFGSDWGFDERPARNQALGGAAVANAEGAAAALTNPAGIAQLDEAEAFASFGVVGVERSAGESPDGAQVRSNFGWPALGSAAVAVRWSDWLTVGLAGGRLLVDGATFADVDGGDTLAASLIELGPQVAVSLPTEGSLGPLRLGLGYAVSLGQVERGGALDGDSDVHFSASLVDFAGFRLGLQSNPIPELHLGAALSLPRTPNGTSEEVLAGDQDNGPGSVSFGVPLTFSVGARFDLDRLGLALEYGYVDSSELSLSVLVDDVGSAVSWQQFSALRDRHLVRLGLEYRLAARRFEIPLRIGYRMQTAAGSGKAPLPFGPLPARVHGVTFGGGVKLRDLELNVAASYDAGGTEVSGPEAACQACGAPGPYGLTVWGLLLDASYRFRL